MTVKIELFTEEEELETEAEEVPKEAEAPKGEEAPGTQLLFYLINSYCYFS